MTYHPKSDFVTVMQERGFIADCTDFQGLDDALLKGRSRDTSGLMPRQVIACRQPDPDHDAALAAKDRQ